jgi:hypothetical protein
MLQIGDTLVDIQFLIRTQETYGYVIIVI